MYVAAGESWRDDEYPVSIADHLSGALHYIRRDHAQAAAGRLGLEYMYGMYVWYVCLSFCSH